MQQPEYVDTTSTEIIGGSEPTTLTKLQSSVESDEQRRRIVTQISGFLAQLPDYIGSFYQKYKQPITAVLLILAAAIALKVCFAVVDALNDIPLLTSIFEFIGIGYSVWFVNRYLLKASKRQELAQELQKLKQQVAGG